MSAGTLVCRSVRAVQIQEFGGPEVLQVADLPMPEPGDGEVLIEVARAGLNFGDTHQRENTYLAKFEVPLVLGGEVAGTTEDGRRVVAMVPSGGYAQYAVAPESTTFPLPDGLDYDAALALLVQGLTAWHLYRTCARIAPGESVVVHAAAGGVGSLAVQLGHGMGAGRVIATASTAEKRSLALDLGADAAVDADPEGMADRLIEANGAARVDAVFEMAGGAVWDESLRALAPFGRLVTYGIASGEQNTIQTGRLMRRSHAVVGFWLMQCLARPDMLEEPLADLFALAAAGDLRVVVGGTYPLAEAAAAQTALEQRRTTGKLLLDPSAES
jgi:NADPH:quinone reductase